MRCNRLFLDVEWSRGKVDQIIQVGAILFDKQYKIITEIYSIVCPDMIEEIKQSSLDLMKLSMEQLIQSDSIETVLLKFNQRFQDYDEIIVWNEEAYWLWISKMKEFGLKVENHRIIILQELLCDTLKKLSFQTALKNFGVKHKQNRLHCSKYDVRYLKSLYQNVQKEYGNYFRWKRNLKFYQSTHSNRIHSENCHVLKRINMENQVNVYPEKIFDGYKICQCCKKDFTFQRSKELHPKTFQEPFKDENIYEMCNYFGLKCTISDNVIFIRTQFSSWRIFHDYEQVTKLYHENNRKDLAHERRKTIKHGFHKQEMYTTSLFSVLKYIRNHDKRYSGNKNRYQQRMDHLFELVAKQSS